MNLLRNLDPDELQFDFLTFYGEGESGDFDAEIIDLGGSIINIPKPAPLMFNRNVGAVKAVLKKKRYDAVHVHIGPNGAYAMIAAKQMGVPIRIAHAHNTKSTVSSFARNCYYWMLRKIINSSLTKCCACSNEAGRYEFSAKNFKSVYSFFPNAIDFSPYFLTAPCDASLRSELGLKKDDHIVIQVGNFKAQKNQAFMIEVAKRILAEDTSYYFVFAGAQSEYGEQVHQLAVEYGIESHVFFLGVRKDIPELLHDSNVYVMPSKWEGLGIALLEAQAVGIPCVVSEVIQPEAVLSRELVTKCELDDMDQWMDAIIKCAIRDHLPANKCKEMINNSPFTIENALKCLDELYS